MQAEKAKALSETGAERMRIATDAARENARAEATGLLEQLEAAIAVTVEKTRSIIDTSIREAATKGRSWSTHTHSERISASRNSRDEVAFIESIADIVTARVVTALEADGYQVSTRADEVIDYRDTVGSPPEYYDTHFGISW